MNLWRSSILRWQVPTAERKRVNTAAVQRSPQSIVEDLFAQLFFDQPPDHSPFVVNAGGVIAVKQTLIQQRGIVFGDDGISATKTIEGAFPLNGSITVAQILRHQIGGQCVS